MQLFSLIAASAAVATTATLVASSASSHEELFNNFITKFDKPYKNDNVERAKRFNIFKKNLEIAAEQQKKSPDATFGVNVFSDLSAAEFKVYHNADRHFNKMAAEHPKMEKFVPKIQNLKDAGMEIDWRKKGAVTGVKNQGQCGSCWAFSTTGVIEGQWFLAGNTLTSLSEQFFTSCAGDENQGCNGGLPARALSWDITGWPQGRVPTEASYPYTSGGGNSGTCKKTGWTVGATIQGQRAVQQSEPAMWGTLYGDGPISIGVDASTWQTYTGGIMTNCPSTQLDHGVLIVGIDLNYHMPYWIIKNSWTPQWGENGYIRVKYGQNECGLTAAPVLAVVNTTNVPTPAPLPPTMAPTPAPPTTQAPATPNAAGWEECFPSPPGMTYLSESMGISMLGPRDVYIVGMVAGSGPNVGPQVAHFDGNINGNFYTLNSKGLPFLEMELAVGGNPMNPRGATCGLEFPIIDKSPFAYFANSSTVLPSTIINPKSFMSVVQGCEASADGSYIIGADQGSTGDDLQALLSKDGGKTFSPVPFGNVVVAQPNCTFPRYATVASENVMYVTLGDWGSNNSQVSAHWKNLNNIKNGINEWDITATRKRVFDKKTGKSKTITTGPMDVYMSYKNNRVEAGASGSSSSSSGYCGNSAEILTTKDGGRTWKSVFSSVDKFYFNEIACASETNCVAVGEGFQDADAGVRIYQTEDGLNWKRVFFLQDSAIASYSFFSVEVADKFTGEYWVGGSKQGQDRQSSGVFFHSTDFGKTWAEYQHNIPALVEISQISFSAESFGSIGYAVALNQFQASNILRWDTRGKLPTQTWFSQKTCILPECGLCQEIQFPQNACVRASGGGAVKAHCDTAKQELVQVLYEDTSCTGKGQTSTVPLNKCMKNQAGQYFEFTCSGGNNATKAFNAATDKVITL